MTKLPGIYVDFAPTKIEREKFQWIRHDCEINAIDGKLYKIDPPVYECSLCHKISEKQTKKCKWCGCEFGKEYSICEVMRMRYKDCGAKMESEVEE